MPTTAPNRLRFALAGVLGTLALTAGAGFAYATSTGSPVVETGYATVVEPSPGAYDCPEDGPEADAQ